MDHEVMLEVQGLTTTFQSNHQSFHAVDGISFQIRRGETLGVVGESGCGKSVTSLSIMGLIKHPGKVSHGQIKFKGTNLLSMSNKQLRQIRGNQISMIFQEPMTSLNPVYTIGNQIGEALSVHTKMNKKQIRERTIELLQMVGIPRMEEIIKAHPHQLSGGMRQRVMIAMAMACKPELLIADEPTTALDVTIQAQILELMRELQQANGMSMMLISHDLGVVSEVCDRVIVMYAGRIVEQGPVRDILDRPQHPYTRGLLASLPKHAKGERRLHFIPGQVPPPSQWGKGCRFAGRCASVMERCHHEIPPLIDNGAPNQAACWLIEKGGDSLDAQRNEIGIS
ncbi:ABC transporter ATP-binding protein [Paenibacillus planticolens]|uniref:ATP-binding cassette domain-containing protein n=1 Tax=Paenibacillus planticolens TaxID=2654976 RepID=A0ABX1ZH87_9BACL|nr:ABC transporter ATP-binding protein [Paenibacillus planticolens]NOU99461.1 ATP-binding cassette domain-containing protein [Paenibacillus planticolens]